MSQVFIVDFSDFRSHEINLKMHVKYNIYYLPNFVEHIIFVIKR